MRRTLPLLVGLGIAALVPLLVAAAIFTIPRSLSGHAQLPAEPKTNPGSDVTLGKMPTQPTEKWRIDARQVFGSSAEPKYLMVVAANRDMAIVVGRAPDQGPAPIMAVDPATGKNLWEKPSELQVDACAFSRDGRLGCIRADGDRAKPSSSELSIVDPRSGRVVATKSIAIQGYPKIRRAGDGFLLDTREYDEGSTSSRTMLSWVSSDGARTWTQTPPDDFDRPELSEAGNVVVVQDFDSGAQVFALDTGTLLYDGRDDLAALRKKAGSDIGTIIVAVTAAGFTVSLSDYRVGALHFFDSNGIRRGKLDEYVLDLSPAGTETDLLPVERESGPGNRGFGVVSTTQRKVLWDTDSDDSLRLSLIGGRFVANTAVSGDGYRRDLFDALTGSRAGILNTSTYQDIEGFDGDRLVFEGDGTADEPGPGAFTAYDPKTGAQVWRVKDTRSADDVNFRIVGPWLFQYDAQVGSDVASISRLAS